MTVDPDNIFAVINRGEQASGAVAPRGRARSCTLATNNDTVNPDTEAPAAAVATDATDSGYVGKHRPHRLGLLRPRVRVSQLAERGGQPQAS